MKKQEPFTVGSGDIFKDFGFSDEEAAELSMKAYLFRTLQKAIKEASATQSDLATRLGIPQPKISDIKNGKMAGFSVERLVNYLLRLNYEICLDAHPAPPGTKGRVLHLNSKELLSV